MYDVIIIGAGASGLMAAAAAASKGARVALLEHKDDIGKKILATGNGRCNFTNTDMSVNKFHGSKALIKNGLSQFNYSDTICFFKELGIPAYDNAGYIYPNSRQAASVVAAFRMELMRLHVDVKTGINITDIKPADDRTGYCIQTDKGSFKSKRLIIACGLTASPKLGSDGSLFRQIEALGHHIQKPLPALCGFSCDGLNFKKITGVRCDATVASVIDGQMTEQNTGELQLADYGISGIPVFQISSLMSRALNKGQKVEVIIDFLPAFSDDELNGYIKDRSITTTDNRSLNEMLNGLLNNKLLLELIHKSGVSPDKKGRLLTDDDCKSLTRSIKHTAVSVKKPRGLEFAQVCAGGIYTKEIDVRTLESKIHPGLYFCGELLDVDGICGGYNLQWAWTSGYIAGEMQ
ncbi:aminoacetone oxidase family FAD-binding enzyme [Agathobacter rectalis]|jgi:predicted Rossmann fold flavoprotein|uniref:Aminoacetone oxidase family FAD-binding enzyme n=1 Tax=Agathobacter rectalis TaxID=39491 RepID=A0A414IWP2_9FIRM|nr:aminoacetone oxidase family FAD-binding enzyme [Agathobacter rectalis]RGT13142.1 aminoacetone oxidase family FAD-binding enzyme [Agathobacter rectalis]RGT20670.1 aminoacetone oxidase family FAD-binding enzyme [Agathobacter rectalis]RHE33579.1 aminoacetone oxidase family FAD-binding enzyme [Agathobacter rectalis]